MRLTLADLVGSKKLASLGPRARAERLFTLAFPFFHDQGVKTILEIGCGSGQFLDALQKSGFSAAGAEADAELVVGCCNRPVFPYTMESVKDLAGSEYDVVFFAWFDPAVEEIGWSTHLSRRFLARASKGSRAVDIVGFDAVERFIFSQEFLHVYERRADGAGDAGEGSAGGAGVGEHGGEPGDGGPESAGDAGGVA